MTVVEGSIADAATVDAAFDQCKPTVLVHAAAAYKDPDAWVEDTLTNVLGAVHLAKASQRHGVERIIYFQTALCYGLKPLEQPITLNHPLDPGNSSYAISKTAGEQYLGLSGIPLLSFRLANAYGPRNLSGPLPTFYSRLTAEKPCFVVDTRRDFIFIEDLVDVVEQAVNGVGEAGMYHISSGSDVSIAELFAATLQAMGLPATTPVEVRPRGEDDAPSILLDPTKTETTFSWKAGTALETGVDKAVDYYRQYGIAETYTHLRIEK